MSGVIQIGELRLRREERRYREQQQGCQHRSILLDDKGGTAECEDCEKQLSLYWVLTMLAGEYRDAMQKVQSRANALRDAEEKGLHLRAAQRVEQAWRSRTMVPACPHCHEAIFPEDGFGGTAVNREMALRRREARKS